MIVYKTITSVPHLLLKFRTLHHQQTLLCGAGKPLVQPHHLVFIRKRFVSTGEKHSKNARHTKVTAVWLLFYVLRQRLMCRTLDTHEHIRELEWHTHGAKHFIRPESTSIQWNADTRSSTTIYHCFFFIFKCIRGNLMKEFPSPTCTQRTNYIFEFSWANGYHITHISDMFDQICVWSWLNFWAKAKT